MHQYLWDPERDNGPDAPAGGPRLFVFNTCPDLIRTIPLQMRDKDNPEDLNTKLEDHAVDSARYLLALRPIAERQRSQAVGRGIDSRFQHMMSNFDKKKRRRALWT